MGQKQRQKQTDFFQTLRHYNPLRRDSHGGSLRNLRSGRGTRPLSAKNPIHCVFKIQRKHTRIGLRSYRSFQMIQRLLKTYAERFFVKIEQVSVQGDHIHLLIRASRRSNYHSFFRVIAGQIAQQYIKEGWMRRPSRGGRRSPVTDTPNSRGQGSCSLWKHRPFTRVVIGWRAYKIVRDYIQLNEKEFLGEIPYRKERLRGLSSAEWQLLWA